VSAILTAEYLTARGEHGSREQYDRVLSKVPDEAPEKQDRL